MNKYRDRMRAWAIGESQPVVLLFLGAVGNLLCECPWLLQQ